MAARFVSVSIPLLLLVVVLAGSRAALALASKSAVEQTCAKATSGARREAELAPFCVSSLQAAPGSDGADARGLAAIATNLTLANYTAAVATIKALERRGGWPEPSTRRALAACRRRYIEALNVVHSAVHALATGDLRGYVSDMEVVGKAATDCEDAFRRGAGNGRPSPLRKVDRDAGNLTVVAMLIVRSLE